MREPTVLFCVGATKAGTSWLHEHLSAHPDCHFRTIKELHYFQLTGPGQFGAALRRLRAETDRLLARLANATDEQRSRIERRLADLGDWRRVLQRRQTDLDAYRAFLTEGCGDKLLVGDITPAYALLAEDRLALLPQVAADTRVVYLMRDPVARLWSHVRMIAQRVAPQSFAAEARALLARILGDDLTGEGAGIVARGDYATILPRLARAFDPARLLVLFYEDMLTLPGLARLSAFLGIRPVAADLDRRVHEGAPLTMTEDERRAARAWLRPQYDYVSGQFATLPAAWRANMEEGLA